MSVKPKQKTIIHFVRHGEVENPEVVVYGQLPGFHLGASGRKQVEETSSWFVHRSVSHIYTSPLERCQQTATILGMALPQASITVDERLIEVKINAQTQGHKRRTPIIAESSISEPLDRVARRMRQFTEEKILAQEAGEVIAVSHSAAIAIFYHSLVYGAPLNKMEPYPFFGSVTSLVFCGLTLVSIKYQDMLAVTQARIK